MKLVLKSLFIIGFILSVIGMIRVGYFQTKAHLAQYLLQSAWQTTKTNKSINKPWSWADTWPVVKIEIPSINLSSLVLKDASGESLAFGPGLMTTDILPGDQGNSFIAAHRDTHFKDIGLLKIEDLINVSNRLGEKILFKIDHIQIVDSRAEQPVIDTDDRRITLVTCYPFDANEANTPFRYLVSAKMTVKKIPPTIN